MRKRRTIRIARLPLSARRLLAAALCATVCGAVGGDASSAPPHAPKFPSEVTTIDGETLDLAELAAHSTVVVVTLKAHWCAVCQRQLLRIRAQQECIAPCELEFIVLAPGPAAELKSVRTRTGFDYPFVEDVDLRIAESLGLRLGDREIQPAIIMLERDLSIGWIQRGRNGTYYGDGELIEKIECWNKVPI